MTPEEMLAVVVTRLDSLDRKVDLLRSDLTHWADSFNDEMAVQEHNVEVRLAEKKSNSPTSKRRMLTSKPMLRY